MKIVETIKMFGPKLDGSGTLVNRDVPVIDEHVYAGIGYKRGSIPAPSAPLVPEPETESEIEPEQSTREALGNALPEDFPGHAALVAEGITTFAELIAVEDVTEIPGIGAATARKITDALEAQN